MKLFEAKTIFTSKKFFYYQLHTAKLESLGYARHYRLLKEIKIAYPSADEQQRIVAILDEAFEGISDAKANAEKNLQNSREFFERYLHSIFTKFYDDKFSTIVKLSELTSDITDGDHMPPPKRSSGIPFITISNINKRNNTIIFSNTFMVSSEYFHNLKPNRKPMKGDVLYTVTGSFGIPVPIMDNREFCFQRHIALVRPKTQTNTKWLYYLMLSSCILKQASSEATGTAQKTVSLTALRNFKVPKIPLPDQKIIADKLDVLSFETKRLESIYQTKIIALTNLKKIPTTQSLQRRVIGSPKVSEKDKLNGSRKPAQNTSTPPLKSAGWGVIEGQPRSSRISNHARQTASVPANTANPNLPITFYPTAIRKSPSLKPNAGAFHIPKA